MIDGESGDVIMPFGKNKGKSLSELEDRYFRWLLDQEWFHKDYPQLVQDVESELRFRRKWS